MGQAIPKQKQIPKPIPKSDKSQKFKWFKVPASQLVGLHQIESLDGAKLPKGVTVEGSCENKYLPARRREKNATKSAQNLNTRHAKLCQLVAATAAPHCTTAPLHHRVDLRNPSTHAQPPTCVLFLTFLFSKRLQFLACKLAS